MSKVYSLTSTLTNNTKFPLKPWKIPYVYSNPDSTTVDEAPKRVDSDQERIAAGTFSNTINKPIAALSVYLSAVPETLIVLYASQIGTTNVALVASVPSTTLIDDKFLNDFQKAGKPSTSFSGLVDGNFTGFTLTGKIDQKSKLEGKAEFTLSNMSYSFTRKITVTSNDLGADTDLILTFDNPEANPGLYKEKFPTCWKVMHFTAKGHCNPSVTYQNQFIIDRPQIEQGKIVRANTWVDIDAGQETKLTNAGDNTYNFSVPTHYSPTQKNEFQVWNETDTAQAFGVGFQHKGRPFAALVVESVGKGNYMIAEFSPILCFYIGTGYEENQVLRHAFESSKMLAAINLTTAPNEINFELIREHDGKLKLTMKK